MKQSRTHFAGRTLAIAALLFSFTLRTASAGQGFAADEQPAEASANHACLNSGAEIECITPDGHEATISAANDQNRGAVASIMNDDTLSCPLQEGETTFIISLPSTVLVDRFSFVNENASARGELKIAVSNYRLPKTSPKWMEVDGRTPFTNKRLFNVSLVGVEARYVKLSFNVEKGGRIAALGLYGEGTSRRFSQQGQQQNFNRVSNRTTTSARSQNLGQGFNFADLNARARVVYVSSGSLQGAKKMIDDDPETSFSFAADDRQPTVILELAEEARLHRVSTRSDMASGHLELYLLDELPADRGNLSSATPLKAAAARDESGKTVVSFDPRGARYIALRWTLEKAGDRGLEVADVNAIGDMTLAMLQLTEAPDLYASNSSGLQGSGQSSPDISSSTIGTLAVPPLLPTVSP